MSQQNFVSVSGISNLEQLEAIEQIKKEEELDFPIAIGFQVSHKSINQGTANPRQPKFVDLPELIHYTSHFGFIPAVHYYAKDNMTIHNDLELLLSQCGQFDKDPVLLQFNTLPPSEETLMMTREMGFKVIFKVPVSNKSSPTGGFAVWKGSKVQDANTGDVSVLVNQLQTYVDLIDYAMFDPSHGTNYGLNLKEGSLAIRFGEEVVRKPELNHLQLLYSGGINPGNVRSLVETLSGYFPDRFSIDIESGVRKDDKLDLSLVREYLINSNFN